MLSVLIVNYKAYGELSRCLESLETEVRQGAAEAIIVDNASSSEAVGRIERRFPWARVLVNERNRGFAAGVNQAGAVAHGEHFLLLNPDATMQRGALRVMIQYFEAHADVAAVGARIYDPAGGVQRSARSFPTPLTGLFGRTALMTRVWPNNPVTRRNLVADETTTEPIDVDWLAGSCLAVRADVFRSVGGMDERFFLYWEDADLCRRIHEAGWRCVYLPGAEAVHQVGRSSRHASTRSIVAFHRSAFRYLTKHSTSRMGYLLLPFAALALATRAVALMTFGRIRRTGSADLPLV